MPGRTSLFFRFLAILLAVGVAWFFPARAESPSGTQRFSIIAAKPDPAMHFVAPERGVEVSVPLGQNRERPTWFDFAWLEISPSARLVCRSGTVAGRAEVLAVSRRPLLVGIVELRI